MVNHANPKQGFWQTNRWTTKLMFHDSVSEAFPLDKSCKGKSRWPYRCFLEFQSWYKLVGKVLKSTLISISMPTKQVKVQFTIEFWCRKETESSGSRKNKRERELSTYFMKGRLLCTVKMKVWSIGQIVIVTGDQWICSQRVMWDPHGSEYYWGRDCLHLQACSLFVLSTKYLLR